MVSNAEGTAHTRGCSICDCAEYSGIDVWNEMIREMEGGKGNVSLMELLGKYFGQS